MSPTIGRIVIYHVIGPTGQKTLSPAIITKVWTDVTVNLTVFLDNNTPLPVTSVVYDETFSQPSGWSWPTRA